MNHPIPVIKDGVQIDTVDPQMTEPFTLETIQELAESHGSEKAVILAKVGSHYFYACLLNKVLYRKLHAIAYYLFRLEANNPLTNLVIEGNVEYYRLNNDEIEFCQKGDKTIRKRDKKKEASVQSSLDSIIKSSLGSDIRISEVFVQETKAISREKLFASSLTQLAPKSLKSVKTGSGQTLYTPLLEDDDAQEFKTDTKIVYTKPAPLRKKASLSKSSVNVTVDIDKTEYKLTYMGNEDDFINSSRFRVQFLFNAIDPSYAELYDLPENADFHDEDNAEGSLFLQRLRAGIPRHVEEMQVEEEMDGSIQINVRRERCTAVLLMLLMLAAMVLGFFQGIRMIALKDAAKKSKSTR